MIRYDPYTDRFVDTDKVSVIYTTDRTICENPKQTNADRIRSMTDEELAKELEWIDDTACAFNRPRTYEGWLDWLKKETDGLHQTD